MTRRRMIFLDIVPSGEWNYCKEIYYEVVKRGAAIGMATVYHMVSTPEEIGVFSRCYRYSLPDRPCVEEQAGDRMDQIQNNIYDRGDTHGQAHGSSVFFVRHK